MISSRTHCNTLQHTATHCNTLQHTATHCNTLCCNTLEAHCYRIHCGSQNQSFALMISSRIHCNTQQTLQHTPLQHTCNALQQDPSRQLESELCVYDCIEDTLQHIATHCNTLQHAHCNTPATHLQHPATGSIVVVKVGAVH